MISALSVPNKGPLESHQSSSKTPLEGRECDLLYEATWGFPADSSICHCSCRQKDPSSAGGRRLCETFAAE